MIGWTILLTAALTGLFCAVFAVVIDAVTDALSMATVIGLAFLSGFCGSLFAQLVLRRT
ncbi:hypothetical protein KUH32_15675 [Thalassococcus sp. CAU 1522]|uniref:CTP synthetase n=1 Tax=Thalassococcus arenae TaxID=2851652 RepID=A0ABS6NB47_9RHOB|nr:hypothetical protein [Thalassococcus arenae]MBV2361203.1 hypothetical protein [Thalassococcus arenae]